MSGPAWDFGFSLRGLALFVMLAGCGSHGGSGQVDCSVRDTCEVSLSGTQLRELLDSSSDEDGDGRDDFEQIAQIIARSTGFTCTVNVGLNECLAFPACSSPTTCDRSIEARRSFILGGLERRATDPASRLLFMDRKDRVGSEFSYFRVTPCAMDELLQLIALRFPDAILVPESLRPGCQVS